MNLYLNGITYVGEWHKHPGQFDSPSMVDLQTMEDITSGGDYKRLGYCNIYY